jgi:hypothetical protein
VVGLDCLPVCNSDSWIVEVIFETIAITIIPYSEGYFVGNWGFLDFLELIAITVAG